MSSHMMPSSSSTSCLCSPPKSGSQTLGAALRAGGSSWGIAVSLANLAVRYLGALACGMMEKAGEGTAPLLKRRLGTCYICSLLGQAGFFSPRSQQSH